MNHSRFLLAVLGLALVASLHADEPAPQRVLVLTNEATLVGRIEMKNGQFEVRTDAGSSLIPGSRVLKLCDTPEDAYAFLKQRVNRKDPLDSLRLARWCVKFGLTEAARQEAEETLKLQPGNIEAQRIAKAGTDTQPSSGTTAATKYRPAVSTSTEHSYSPETLRSFAQRVQPMLVNSCATGACHGGPKGGSFVLQRPPSNGQMPPQLTRQNLVQTLKLIDKEDSPNSLLLRKALEAHGGHAKPPLNGKDVPAYQTLESWVLKTAPPKDDGTLSGEIVAVSARSQEHPPEKPAADPVSQVAHVAQPRLPAALEETFASMPTTTAAPESTPVKAPAEPKPTMPEIKQSVLPKPKTDPQDPFDPVQFNEVYHPSKK